jgi:hypothetical protein
LVDCPIEIIELFTISVDVTKLVVRILDAISVFPVSVAKLVTDNPGTVSVETINEDRIPFCAITVPIFIVEAETDET